jgi:hypothetical protein
MLFVPFGMFFAAAVAAERAKKSAPWGALS